METDNNGFEESFSSLVGLKVPGILDQNDIWAGH